MPDGFRVLKKDHDEVKAMLAQLDEGPKASTGATQEQLAFRRQALDEVIIEQSKHVLRTIRRARIGRLRLEPRAMDSSVWIELIDRFGAYGS